MKEDKFIREFIEELEEVPNIKIDLNTRFRDLDDWDSMTSMMIITMIDENYNVIITPEEMLKAKTLKDLYNLI
jgi:acyl carrier protein